MRILKALGLVALTAIAVWGLYLSTVHYGEERFQQGAREMYKHCDKQEKNSA